MDISPLTLEFTGNFQQPTTEYLVLTNTSDVPYAYKVKTTAPKLYCVRPNAAIIAPGATIQVSIILQGFSEPLPKDFKCKDKFLIVSVPTPGIDEESFNVSEQWGEIEAKNKSQVSSTKLRVNYVVEDGISSSSGSKLGLGAGAVGATGAAAGIAGAAGAHTGSSGSNSGTHAGDISQTSHNNTSDAADTSLATALGIVASLRINKAQPAEDLKRELDESELRIKHLSEKLDTNERSNGLEPTSTKSESISGVDGSKQDPVPGVSLAFAAILVLIAFILGWILL